MAEIFKDFAGQVVEEKIKLSELEVKKLMVVTEVKNQAEEIFNRKKFSLNPEERKQTETILKLLETKIEEEISRRSKDD
jgi:hypothetical protein